MKNASSSNNAIRSQSAGLVIDQTGLDAVRRNVDEGAMASPMIAQEFMVHAHAELTHADELRDWLQK